MKNLKELRQMTGSALEFARETRAYAKNNGYILLHEEPTLRWEASSKGYFETLTTTQSIYVADSDIELTVVAYISHRETEEIAVETTFDFLLGKSSSIAHIYDWLRGVRDERTNRFYLTTIGSQEEGFCEDEFSVVIRKRHRRGEENTFKQWDELIQLIQQSQNDSAKWMSFDPSVGPKS